MPSPERKTKIVATIGPASNDEETLAALVEAGMDGVRLNFSHGTHADHELSARRARAVQAEAGRPLALIADLQGPKIRIGDLEAPRELQVGEAVVVAGEEQCGRDDLPVAPDVLGAVLEAGDEILIDDGHVRLRVERMQDARALCEVVTGGLVEPHKGVNVPGVPLPVPSVTEKDLADLDFALGLEVDYVALSFVRSHTDVAALKSKIEAAGSQAWVIAKIELKEAVLQLESILDVTDAVMIARGDLGVEIGAAEVPLLQKQIILGALERGKPAITATQMLESMIHRPEPTRAEASDVANAILDGSSALMLSAETAVGEYPIEAVETMARIARAVEPSLGYRHQLPFRARGADRRARHVERRLRSRGGTRREGDPRADVHRPNGVGGRTPPAAPPGRRPHARGRVAAAHGDRMGRHAARDPRGHRRRGALADLDRSGTRRGHRRGRRPRRPHRGHRREHPGLHQRHQGRRRLTAGVAVLTPNVASWRGGPRRRRRRGSVPRVPGSVGGGCGCCGRSRSSGSPSTSTTGRSPRTSRRGTT